MNVITQLVTNIKWVFWSALAYALYFDETGMAVHAVDLLSHLCCKFTQSVWPFWPFCLVSSMGYSYVAPLPFSPYIPPDPLSWHASIFSAAFGVTALVNRPDLPALT